MLTILLLSLLAASILTLYGKFIVIVGFSSRPFLQIYIYYTILAFAIQIVCLFWLVYMLVDYVIIFKYKNKLIISFFTGLATFLIIQILVYNRFEAYYFEPFKNNYLSIPFFLIGLLYPYLSTYLKFNLFKKSLRHTK